MARTRRRNGFDGGPAGAIEIAGGIAIRCLARVDLDRPIPCGVADHHPQRLQHIFATATDNQQPLARGCQKRRMEGDLRKESGDIPTEDALERLLFTSLKLDCCKLFTRGQRNALSAFTRAHHLPYPTTPNKTIHSTRFSTNTTIASTAVTPVQSAAAAPKKRLLPYLLMRHFAGRVALRSFGGAPAGRTGVTAALATMVFVDERVLCFFVSGMVGDEYPCMLAGRQVDQY